jgi:uncharacterized protein (UPF0335 family)
MSLRFKILSALIFILLFIACNRSSPKEDVTQRVFRFEPIKGITYYEVRRTFASGIAFNDLGFRQKPEWAVQFLSDTSVQVYSPSLDKMIDFELIFSHDGVYNFAREWFRVKEISKESLKLQRLEVNAKQIAKDVRSEVFMTFYSEAYLKKINKTVEELRKPSAIDSAYVKERARLINANPSDSSRFFAANNPVQFIGGSQITKIEKKSIVDDLQNRTASYDYLYPEYDVDIKPAYKDFAYAISAIVDSTGKIKVYRFNAMDDYRENRKKVLQGIVDIYIQKQFKVKPGNTLGYTHSSVIVLNLVGKQ